MSLHYLLMLYCVPSSQYIQAATDIAFIVVVEWLSAASGNWPGISNNAPQSSEQPFAQGSRMCAIPRNGVMVFYKVKTIAPVADEGGARRDMPTLSPIMTAALNTRGRGNSCHA